MARPLLHLLLVFLSCAHCKQGPSGDVARLLAQRDSISNWEEFSRANELEGWNADTPVCEWTGVVCDNATVVELNLSCMNGTDGLCAAEVRAEGTLAPELAAIKSLEALLLQGQKLTGPLPPIWGLEGAFPSLVVLDLSSNDLAGGLPRTWASETAFPALEAMQLSGNPLLCGEVPPSLQPRLVCGEDAEGCTDGMLPACSVQQPPAGDGAGDGKQGEGEKKPRNEPVQCIPGKVPSIPSFAEEYSPRIAAKANAQQQRANNKQLVQQANKGGVRYDMVMYGDSITWKASQSMDVWRTHFGALPGPSAPLGVIFNQVSDLAYRITTGDELFSLPPKVVVLLIGVNNIERGPPPAPDLAGLLQWLKGAYPGSHLVVLNLLPTSVDVFLDIEGTNEKYREVAKEMGVAFSTCGSNIDPTDPTQLYDGIHPDPKGLDIIFSCLGPEVAAAVAASPC